jgi:hypothetical protein
MDNLELVNKLKIYEDKVFNLENELYQTKSALKKYTDNTKKYYDNHKEEIKQKVKEYKEQTNYVVPKDVIKERNKKAYLKRKEKLEKENVKVKRRKHMKQLHEILTPKEETNCRIFVNRDVNACKNILLLGKCYLTTQTRPQEFTRQVVKKEVIKKPRKVGSLSKSKQQLVVPSR